MFKLSSVVNAIGHFIGGLFSKAIPTLEEEAKKELANVEVSIAGFAKTDLGKLAIDAVSLASEAVNSTDDQMFEAAKAKFIADAKTAGHDLSAIGKGVVDWMIQTAYTFTANVIAAAASSAPAA